VDLQPSFASKARSWPWLGGLALLVLAMFFDVLLVPREVLGTANADMVFQFLPWREFGFSELAKGNLPLWNPHIFSGAPFFGGMQSALLYPPNWLFLFLPLPLATNWSIALNVWLAGTFMYVWALQRGVQPFAAFLSAALLMFCGPHFLHVSAGHLSNLSAMPWVPLLLLAIDRWLASRRPVWCLVGMLAVAMQILAGHPQYVYFAAVIAGVYSLVMLLELGNGRLAAAAGLMSFYAGGALLAAVQLLTGIQEISETIRGQPLSYRFAAMVSFPPENFLTLVAPGFFGDMLIHDYWGRWYLWEACAFIGVIGLALAAYGGASRVAGKKALLITAAVATLLALGDNTPLFRLLYDWLPWFDKFRGSGKFLFFAVLMLVLLAGHGFDRILRERAVRMPAIRVAGATAIALCVAAVAIRTADWRAVTAAVFATGESYAGSHSSAAFSSASQAFASLGLLVGGLTFGAATGLAAWTRWQPRAAALLGALAIIEVFAFARMHRPTFDAAQVNFSHLREFLAANPGEYRILNLAFPNSAMSLRAFDAWGYDPGVTRRYAEFIQWSIGGDPAAATQYMTFRRYHPLLSMLRVKYVMDVEKGMIKIQAIPAPPLRRLELVGSYEVHEQRDAILRAMGAPSFDPRKEVILESQPHPAPVAGPEHGRAALIREGTDFMEIEADVSRPSVLLVTDAWTSGWRASALPGSSQSTYELMPANYALRAVPLATGTHRLRLYYAPLAFRVGAIISGLAWLAWIVAALLVWRGMKKRPAHA
jgi:hypothetical protein